jgi:small subunit ribosomal protein S17
MSTKRLKGTVVSDKMNKTVVVTVEMPKRHAIYDKIVKNTKRFKAHNELGAVLGDKVTIEECKPYSKETTWKIVEKK